MKRDSAQVFKGLSIMIPNSSMERLEMGKISVIFKGSKYL
jgi:hypothetical protein